MPFRLGALSGNRKLQSSGSVGGWWQLVTVRTLVGWTARNGALLTTWSFGAGVMTRARGSRKGSLSDPMLERLRMETGSLWSFAFGLEMAVDGVDDPLRPPPMNSSLGGDAWSESMELNNDTGLGFWSSLLTTSVSERGRIGCLRKL